MTQNYVVADPGAPAPPPGIALIPNEVVIVEVGKVLPTLVARRAANDTDPISERLHYVKLNETCILEGTLDQLQQLAGQLGLLAANLKREHQVSPIRIARLDGGREL